MMAPKFRGMLDMLAVLAILAVAPKIHAEVKLGDLQKQVQQFRETERKVLQERESRFRSELQKQERLAQEVVARRNAADARSTALDNQYKKNTEEIANLRVLLSQSEGNLGELFGVTRQVAGDTASALQQSLLSTQFTEAEGREDRIEFLRRLASAKELPSIVELERLWLEIGKEMVEAGKVARYQAEVLLHESNVEKREMEVLRVGPFTAIGDGQYLNYVAGQRSLITMSGTLPRKFTAVGENLMKVRGGSDYVPAVVDPASGALLSLYVQRPDVIERIHRGEIVGYVIVVVGVLGVLLALGQAIYLVITKASVSRQLRNLSQPNRNNPLGRVLLAFRGDGSRLDSSELAELRISEAVLREVPRLERFQAFLRLAVAAGPLLGLIGTVIGMIITFHAIVASGTSDPKMMANGIGQAMIATVLGLGIAIPLLFINAGLATLSRSVTQVLDEQSQSLLAERTNQAKRAA